MKCVTRYARSPGALAFGAGVLCILLALPPVYAQQPGGLRRDHYKTWRVVPQQFMTRVMVQDQFMQDSLQLTMIECLSNPVTKIHGVDTFEISNPNNHLTWYRALGRDTVLMLSYANQFESTAVSIGHVEYLLVPTLKQPHAPPETLDHYKVYQILDPVGFRTPVWLMDQFDMVIGQPDVVDSLRPVYFLTPAIKNNERPDLYDPVTHYVAYEILPPRTFPQSRMTMDQFGPHELQMQFSQYLLVPSRKYVEQPLLGSICGSKFNDLNCNGAWDAGEPPLAGWTINLAGPVNTFVLTNAAGAYCFNNLPAGSYTVSEVLQAGWTQTMPPAPGTYGVALLAGQTVVGVDFGNCIPQTPQGTGPEHYKMWRVAPQPFISRVLVEDQFMQDSLDLNMIEGLSNPVMKIHGADTFRIVNPNNHLTWYRATGRDTMVYLTYANQFESTAVSIGIVEYLLLPTQKFPHAPPETLDHYKAYMITNPAGFRVPVWMRDQFDSLYGLPEITDSLRPVYFLTPAIKNNELQLLFDSATHYVAYEFVPPRLFQIPVNTMDQFGPHELPVQFSQYLLVPSRKHVEEPLLGSICGSKFNDLNCNGVWDGSEPGLPGWTVNLAGPVNTSTLTNTAGAYCFGNLPAGNYTVSEVLQPGWTQTMPPAPGTYAVSLLPGQTVSGQDFGNCVQGPQPGEGKDHYKTWMHLPLQIDQRVLVEDQFMEDSLHIHLLQYLSNPVRKIHQLDTFNIMRPNNHLNWYAATGRDTAVRLTYANQFQSATVTVGGVAYLLVPAQKLPHAPPESLDHYKAYFMTNGQGWLHAPVWLRDQFDSLYGASEFIDSLRPAFFLTPAIKNNERPALFDSTTHYVAYEILPQRIFQIPMNTLDQFGPHEQLIQASQYLLVPSTKVVVPCTTSVVDSIGTGWNLVALSLTGVNPAVTSLFPNAVSQAFEFVPGTGYVAQSTLEIGKGYWLKFPSAEVDTFTGCPITCDTIPVSAGWNLIGTPSSPVATSSVTSIPAGIIATSFFGYGSGGYAPVTTLLPFKGYWVKVTQAGSLILCGGGGALGESIGAGGPLDGLSFIQVSGASGGGQTLLFAPEGSGLAEPDRYELPPLPPSGVFDARFSTERYLETVAPGEERTVPIRLSSADAPLTVVWEIRDGSMTAKLVADGRQIPLTRSGQLTLAEGGTSLALRLGADGSLPAEYALIQNYPNPFNPVTTIRYELPVPGDVLLKVYDLLGREVATLVNEEESAGYKAVQWDARGVASGVYLYRLQAGTFTSMKKMVLIR